MAPLRSAAARGRISFAKVVELAMMLPASRALATSAIICAKRSAVGFASNGLSTTITGANRAASAATESTPLPITSSSTPSPERAPRSRATARAEKEPGRACAPSCSATTSMLILRLAKRSRSDHFRFVSQPVHKFGRVGDSHAYAIDGDLLEVYDAHLWLRRYA